MRVFTAFVFFITAAGVSAQGLPPGWTVNPGDYQYNANVIVKVKLNNAALPPGNNILGAFAGTQARGNTTAINIGSERVFFLTMYANTSNEVIRFKIYIPSLDTVATVVDSVIFIPNGIYGSVSDPLVFNAYLTLDRRPLLPGIPDQTIYSGYSFTPFDLDDFLYEQDGDSVEYFYTAGPDFTLSINQQNVVRVEPVNAVFTGSGLIIFGVRDVTAAGLSSVDSVVYTISPNPLHAPANLHGAAFRNPRRIVLNWEDNSNLEKRYIVERKRGDSSAVDTFSVIDTLPPNSTQYIDTQISDSTRYTYRVYAANDTVRSKYSNYLTILSLYDIQPVHAPDSLTAIRLGTASVRLRWIDRSDNELGFFVERKTGDSASINQYMVIGTAPANFISYTDSLLQGDTSVYTYRIRAFNQDTVSGYSNQAVAMGTIPVELSYFRVMVEGARIKLYWKTISEKNNSGFNVQRAEQGKPWNTLGFVSGNGTTLSPNDYEFYDSGISTGSTYKYRIVQIDFDGSTHYSDEAVVFVEPRSSGFELFQNYPNPFNPVTNITYSLPAAGYVKLHIFDGTGAKVLALTEGYHEGGSYNAEFNAAGIHSASGIYIYALYINGQLKFTRKMVLMK